MLFSYLPFLIPSSKEGNFKFDLNLFIDIALSFRKLIYCLMVNHVRFWMMLELPCFSANEIEQGKRTVIDTFFKEITVLIKWIYIYSLCILFTVTNDILSLIILIKKNDSMTFIWKHYNKADNDVRWQKSIK
jgi:hypothetical protein